LELCFDSALGVEELLWENSRIEVQLILYLGVRIDAPPGPRQLMTSVISFANLLEG
jgi:hypothetical protein